MLKTKNKTKCIYWADCQYSGVFEECFYNWFAEFPCPHIRRIQDESK